MAHEHNKQFSFHYFNIDQKRGMAIYSIVVANLLHYCMCTDCGEHTQSDLAINHLRENVVPTLKKGDKWTAKEIKERDFMWFTVGVLLNESDNAPEFGIWLLSFKRDTYENTLLNVIDDSKGYIGEQLSPLN